MNRRAGRPAEKSFGSGSFQPAIPVGNSSRPRIHWTTRALGIKLVNMQRRLKFKSVAHVADSAGQEFFHNATRNAGKEIRPAGLRTAFRRSGKALLRA